MFWMVLNLMRFQMRLLTVRGQWLRTYLMWSVVVRMLWVQHRTIQCRWTWESILDSWRAYQFYEVWWRFPSKPSVEKTCDYPSIAFLNSRVCPMRWTGLCLWALWCLCGTHYCVASTVSVCCSSKLFRLMRSHSHLWATLPRSLLGNVYDRAVHIVPSQVGMGIHGWCHCNNIVVWSTHWENWKSLTMSLVVISLGLIQLELIG